MPTVRLGAEYDEGAVQAARWALERLGAIRLDGSWGVGGSQEISSETWSLGEDRVRLEAETYIGLLLDGPESLVATIEEMVLERLGLSKSA